jgi:ribose transport system permease protein
MSTTTQPALAAPVRSPTSGRLRSPAAADLVRSVLPVSALLVMVVYFSVSTDAFLSTQNFTFMSGQAGVLLLAALGATLVIIMGSVDLAVGSTALVTGAILAKVISGGTTSTVLVVALAVAVGVGVGLLNGVVFAYGRVPSFITTLGTLSLLSGVGLAIMDGSSVAFDAPNIQSLATGQLIAGVQNAALIALGALAVVWLLSRRTRFGLYLYALGGNETVVQLAGVKVKRVKVLGMITSGVTAALAGLLLAAQLGSAGPSLGATTLLDSVAAIVIGGTALSGGVGGVERTLLGVLILTVLSNGLNQMGVQSFTQTVIKGAVIIVAAVVTMASQRKAVIK